MIVIRSGSCSTPPPDGVAAAASCKHRVAEYSAPYLSRITKYVP